MKCQHLTTKRILLTSLVAAMLGLIAFPAAGQDNYPSKPITIVVPYPPGGSNDVFARSMAKELADVFKQPVIVDNRAGGSGSTGTALVARAPADGYTLVAVSSSMTTHAALHAATPAKLPFDPVKDFTPVALLAQGPFIVAVTNAFPAKSPAELIAAIRQRPGAYNYGTSGTGSVNQFGTELLKAQAAPLFITHIPYRGMGPAVTDLIGGQVQMIMASGPSMLPMVRAGRVRAVGITSLKPSAIAPDLVPMSSAVPGYEYALWWGVLAPAGAPGPVVAKLNAAINQVLSKPAIQTQFLNEGAQATAMSPTQFAALIATDIARWKQLARQQNIVAE